MTQPKSETASPAPQVAAVGLHAVVSPAVTYKLMVSYNCGIFYGEAMRSTNREDFMPLVEQYEREYLRWCIETEASEITNISSIHINALATVAAARANVQDTPEDKALASSGGYAADDDRILACNATRNPAHDKPVDSTQAPILCQRTDDARKRHKHPTGHSVKQPREACRSASRSRLDAS